MAVNAAGEVRSNIRHNEANAVTWGVFPAKEVIQPTVVDPTSFSVWKVSFMLRLIVQSIKDLIALLSPEDLIGQNFLLGVYGRVLKGRLARRAMHQQSLSFLASSFTLRASRPRGLDPCLSQRD